MCSGQYPVATKYLGFPELGVLVPFEGMAAQRRMDPQKLRCNQEESLHVLQNWHQMVVTIVILVEIHRLLKCKISSSIVAILSLSQAPNLSLTHSRDGFNPALCPAVLAS